MIVNFDIINELCNDAGDARKQKAIVYEERGKVKLMKVEYNDENNFEVQAEVYGKDVYDTKIQVKNGEIQLIECDCPDYYNTYGVCKHTLATMLKFNNDGMDFIQNKSKLIDVKKNNKYNSFSQIVKTLYNEELDSIDSNLNVEFKNNDNIKIEPRIIYDKFSKEMKIDFKIGNKRMYKLKNLAEFYKLMINGEVYKYGEKLKFVHKKEMFDEDSQKLLQFLLKYSEMITLTNSSANSNYRYYGKTLN